MIVVCKWPNVCHLQFENEILTDLLTNRKWTLGQTVSDFPQDLCPETCRKLQGLGFNT